MQQPGNGFRNGESADLFVKQRAREEQQIVDLPVESVPDDPSTNSQDGPPGGAARIAVGVVENVCVRFNTIQPDFLPPRPLAAIVRQSDVDPLTWRDRVVCLHGADSSHPAGHDLKLQMPVVEHHAESRTARVLLLPRHHDATARVLGLKPETDRGTLVARDVAFAAEHQDALTADSGGFAIATGAQSGSAGFDADLFFLHVFKSKPVGQPLGHTGRSMRILCLHPGLNLCRR